ncbi:MAG: C40 family peptidase [Spirochaetes bacterium]|nr:C40 family peptidase [Spirochaetota bacterium]
MKNITTILFCLILALSAEADSLDDTLKDDFSKQEAVKIRFEVNKSLFSYEAGKFKIENIKKNRDKIRAITDRIIPWAVMERMNPAEVARIIVYMYHADEAGTHFLDSEDLIPLIARHEITLKNFVLMVQYNNETKTAGIPEEIRDAFLGYAFSKGWDGLSILAGGRGLIIAKLYGLDINKTASLLARRIPANGAKASPASLTAVIENVIGESINEKNARIIINNLADSQKAFTQAENSPKGLKAITESSSQSNTAVKTAGSAPTQKHIKNTTVDKEPGIIIEDKSSAVRKENWQILKIPDFYEAIRPWLGTRYKYGGKSKKTGIDCSGFTRAVLTDGKVGVPPEKIGYSSVSQSTIGSPVNRNSIRAGDLVFFSASPARKKITHVGLATSAGYFTHASMRGVVNDDLNKKWWAQRFITSRRIFAEVKK